RALGLTAPRHTLFLERFDTFRRYARPLRREHRSPWQPGQDDPDEPASGLNPPLWVRNLRLSIS
ncbi:MAG: hypothetical protein ACREXU_17635, partial [Gammaproteobacteria bacterium]